MIRFEIHGDNLTITDAIRNYIEEKVGKLERYFNNVPNAVAHVRVKTYSNSTTKIEVTIIAFLSFFVNDILGFCVR